MMTLTEIRDRLPVTKRILAPEVQMAQMQGGGTVALRLTDGEAVHEMIFVDRESAEGFARQVREAVEHPKE